MFYYENTPLYSRISCFDFLWSPYCKISLKQIFSVPETKTTDENLEGLTEPELILRLIWLYLDIVKLSKNFDSILDDLVWPVLKDELSETGQDYFVQSLKTSKEELEEKLDVLSQG